MFTNMTSAETLGWISIILLIGLPAIALLTMWGAFHAPFSTGHTEWQSGHTEWQSGQLGTPGAFREPADPSYVDHLIRVRGTYPVIHNPAPLVLPAEEWEPDEPLPVVAITPPWRSMTLADLVEGARYVVPASAPVSPARHASGVVDTASRASRNIGRHRAPELVAA